ncbi:MAG: hypothetical protein HUK11_08710 [Muribaculaceae bacterium]|nr:hypothetical protein [Muribaculaceae bacterium]
MKYYFYLISFLGCIYFLLLAMIVGMAFVACGDANKDDEPANTSGGSKFYDIRVIELDIYADDGTNDLFDPSYPGNICRQVSVTYNGEEYFYSPPKKDMFKYYQATFRGLRHDTTTFVSLDYTKEWVRHRLSFGEFDGSAEYKNATFIVNWPDGKKDKIVFSRKCWQENGELRFSGSVRLNGKEYDSLSIFRTF